jgi:hypothetical protein
MYLNQTKCLSINAGGDETFWIPIHIDSSERKRLAELPRKVE